MFDTPVAITLIICITLVILAYLGSNGEQGGGQDGSY